jgi:CDP-diglyceride synthetase
VISLLKPLFKYILILIIFEIFILITGFLVISNFNVSFQFGEIAVLSGIFTLLAGLVLFIFFRGQTKDPGSQTMHILVAVSLKFMIELIVALIWFFIAKKTEASSVLLFFVLYLAFTLFSVIVILKTLKHKSL